MIYFRSPIVRGSRLFRCRLRRRYAPRSSHRPSSTIPIRDPSLIQFDAMNGRTRASSDTTGLGGGGVKKKKAGRYEFRPNPEHRSSKMHRGRPVVRVALPPTRDARRSRAQLRGVLRMRLHARPSASRLLHVPVLEVHALEADDILPQRTDIRMRGGGDRRHDNVQAESEECARLGHIHRHQHRWEVFQNHQQARGVSFEMIFFFCCKCLCLR